MGSSPPPPVPLPHYCDSEGWSRDWVKSFLPAGRFSSVVFRNDSKGDKHGTSHPFPEKNVLTSRYSPKWAQEDTSPAKIDVTSKSPSYSLIIYMSNHQHPMVLYEWYGYWGQIAYSPKFTELQRGFWCTASSCEAQRSQFFSELTSG